MKLGAVASLALLGAVSASAQDTATVEQHYYANEATTPGEAHPWLVMLPGGGGIEVFGDEHFYFDVAKEWNEAGYDVLVVHYQAAAPLVKGAQQDNLALLEKTVVQDALAKAKANGWLDLQCPGFVMGYSAGGAGTMALAADPPANLAGAIGFYPLVATQPKPYTPKVPVLVLQGDLDQATPRDTLDAFVAGSTDPKKFSVFHLPSAHHAFDIPSLATPVDYNGATFQYNNGAEQAAHAQVVSFRTAHLSNANAPAECRSQ